MTLKGWLTDNGVSNVEFGQRIGRTAEAVRRYANGERIPDRETMPAIVEATNGEVTANDFFGIAGSAEPDVDVLDDSPGKAAAA